MTELIRVSSQGDPLIRWGKCFTIASSLMCQPTAFHDRNPELPGQLSPKALIETSNLISRNDGIPNHSTHYSAIVTKPHNVEEDYTTWKSEARTCAGYSQSLVLTLLLQYSLNLTSVITVGRLGTAELGAVSLASVTANITGYAVFQGLATSLDTLCPQAFGSGRKHLVGIQVQRMVCFLWLAAIPIGGLWLMSPWILTKVVPDPKVAALAGRYLRFLLLGMPGYAAFESGKRFFQAQAIFDATLWVLLICAPLNALMSYGFVWWLHWGFIGSPVAVATTMNVLPVLLFLYGTLIRGGECWDGFRKEALRNWRPMVRLALPGFLMVEAELFAFEVLTLLAAYISTKHLAASSIVSNIVLVLWLIPYSMSMATGTRIAMLIGEMKPKSAITTAKVTSVVAFASGTSSAIILIALRDQLAGLFTSDVDVIHLASGALPICALYQPLDAIGSNCHGILRGLGMQKVGGLVGLLCWYLLGIPVSIGTGFGLGWELRGLWFGVALALGSVAAVEGLAIYSTSWEKMVERAKDRSLMG